MALDAVSRRVVFADDACVLRRALWDGVRARAANWVFPVGGVSRYIGHVVYFVSLRADDLLATVAVACISVPTSEFKSASAAQFPRLSDDYQAHGDVRDRSRLSPS